MRSRRARSVIAIGAAVVAVLASAAGGSPARADASGQSREAVIAQYQSVLLPTLGVPADWTGSVATCTPGSTSPAYEQATLTAINYMRALAGQPTVSLDAGMNAPAQAAALMMLAANDLSHSPGRDWPCYSDAGAAGAGSSNLYIGRSGPAAIVGYMADPGTNNAVVGHRRWILFSGAAAFGTGSTGGSNALKVFGGPERSSNGAWIPWPAAGYFPWQLEPEGRWSLGMPGASFDGAAVAVTAGGSPVPVAVTAPQYGYGDNTLSWDMDLPETTDQGVERDLTVDVAITGIRLADGTTTDYRYTVNLVDASPHRAPGNAYLTSAARVRGGLKPTWQAPEDSGGEPVTYTVTATPTGRNAGRLPVRACRTQQTTCLISGVSRTAAYRLTLVATNTVGSSEPTTRIVPAAAARHARP